MIWSATPSVKKFQSFSVNTVAISSCNFEKKDQDMFTMDITKSSYLRNICAVQNKLGQPLRVCTRIQDHAVWLYSKYGVQQFWEKSLFYFCSSTAQCQNMVCGFKGMLTESAFRICALIFLSFLHKGTSDSVVISLHLALC